MHLGYAFLRNFITNYDYSWGSIAFAVNSNSPDGTSISTNQVSDEGVSKFVLGFMAIGLFFMLFIIGYVIYWCRKMKKEEEEES